jgi:phosphoribosylaminoimidazole-succinocarboxamide synthase
MRKIPEKVRETDLSYLLTSLSRVFQGKVRDTYELEGSDWLLVVASDRLSIFDFVLPCLVEKKGEVLTALTIFWLTQILKVKNHLVAFGSEIDNFLPTCLRKYPELQARSLIVKKLKILPLEFIVRGYLTGSGWLAYQKERKISGIQLPAGLFDGAKLARPILTPTTKSESGHDVQIPLRVVKETFGEKLIKLSLKIYQEIATYAFSQGVILADTKFEFGEGEILADEVGTPDSSRFWDKKEWEAKIKEKKSPTPYDKQLVRDWGKTIETPFGVRGINNLEPENPDHLAFVHQLEVPEEIISATTERYLQIFQRLTGQSLENFQRKIMKINI